MALIIGKQQPIAYVALSDGTILKGQALGARGEAAGEIVFNTSMTGYQEILTDPSYRGQIVTMTYPLIGNYGVNPGDRESARPWVEGFIVREASRIPSNWRSTQSLPEYLQEHNIVGVEGVDTRMLTRHIRTAGAMPGIISSLDPDPERLIEKARSVPGLDGINLAAAVSCSEPWEWKPELGPGERFVALMDYGFKYNIAEMLRARGCRVRIFPGRTPAERVLEEAPHGVMLSNGPGDPAAVDFAIREIPGFLGRVPLFGICLGHQLMGLALGGDTYKLKFGHRGANQPVMDLDSGTVDITSQNHGYAVDMGSLGGKVRLTHVNLNDDTVEGMEHVEYPAFSVQYHPEASPGPHDAGRLFDRFITMMEANR